MTHASPCRSVPDSRNLKLLISQQVHPLWVHSSRFFPKCKLCAIRGLKNCLRLNDMYPPTAGRYLDAGVWSSPPRWHHILPAWRSACTLPCTMGVYKHELPCTNTSCQTCSLQASPGEAISAPDHTLQPAARRLRAPCCCESASWLQQQLSFFRHGTFLWIYFPSQPFCHAQGKWIRPHAVPHSATACA